MKSKTDIVQKAQEFIAELFKEKLTGKYVYHNFDHTQDTVSYTMEIAENYKLSDDDREALILAAWFHDAGYTRNYSDHEQASADIAREFLSMEFYSEEKIEKICSLILSTKYESEPKSKLEEIIHDADYINIGRKSFNRRGELLRIEWEEVIGKHYKDLEWAKIQLDFLLSRKFFTDYAIKEFNPRREKNIEEQHQRISELTEKSDKENSKKKPKEGSPGRGIETMYRSIYRNHINLSAIADRKANMMISINAIIMSIIITAVGSGFTLTGTKSYDSYKFVFPIIVLLVGCLLSIIFAILSANPKVTQNEVSKKKINNKESSVLFFGNFAQMEREEFMSHINELMQKKEMLYDNMTIDIYYLGKVLTVKYKQLRFSYGTFMAGLIVTVLSFLFIFITSKK